MRAIRVLFPWHFQLTMLQLEGYNYGNFLIWILSNFFKRSADMKRNLVMTPKARFIFIASLGFAGLMVVVTSLIWSAVHGLLIALFALMNPYLLFGCSLLLLKPYELCNRKSVKSKTKKIILENKKLNVIAITGSYGKTSVKELIYQLSRNYFKTLRTPESYNTVFGIAKVVDYELSSDHDLFICEMGAYGKGEITELAEMVPPKWGVLTGITSQHLVRFGTIENTISAKFELFDSVGDVRRMIFNLDDANIINELKKRGIGDAFGYGIDNPTAGVRAENISFNPKGSIFKLIAPSASFKVNTKLFGYAGVLNVLAAVATLEKIGIKANEIKYSISELTPFDNRQVVKNYGNAFVVDNTYSSNEVSFATTIKTASCIKGTKVLVTPGIVELGSSTARVHTKLGVRAAEAFDFVVLVGDTDRTRSLQEGIGNTKTKIIPDTRLDYKSELKDLANKYDWIFLENDVTQNY